MRAVQNYCVSPSCLLTFFNHHSKFPHGGFTKPGRFFMPVIRPTLAVLFMLTLMISSSGPARASEEEPLILLKAQAKIQNALNSLDEHASETCRQLAGVEFDSYQAGKVLRWLRVKEMQVIVASTISPKGVLVRVEPYEYSRFQGSDISKQPQVQFMMTKHQPVLSQLFQTVEGYWSVDLERPIIDPKGEFRGALSATFHPAPFAKAILDRLDPTEGIRFYLLQQDGLVLYSNRLEEIGINVLETALYKADPEVQKTVNKILAEPKGDISGRHFIGKEATDTQRRHNYWTTVELHGTKWRLGFADPIL